jgi:hypothetical protein
MVAFRDKYKYLSKIKIRKIDYCHQIKSMKT